MNIRIRITREVAVEVGRDMVVTGIIGVKESIATEAGAAVQVLIIINPARGVDMMMSGVVGAGHMEGIKCCFSFTPSSIMNCCALPKCLFDAKWLYS